MQKAQKAQKGQKAPRTNHTPNNPGTAYGLRWGFFMPCGAVACLGWSAAVGGTLYPCARPGRLWAFLGIIKAPAFNRGCRLYSVHRGRLWRFQWSIIVFMSSWGCMGIL